MTLELLFSFFQPSLSWITASPKEAATEGRLVRFLKALLRVRRRALLIGLNYDNCLVKLFYENEPDECLTNPREDTERMRVLLEGTLHIRNAGKSC